MSLTSPADRVRELPPYLFAAIDKMKSEARERGVDLIDFGIGDPDMPTPKFVIESDATIVAPLIFAYVLGW